MNKTQLLKILQAIGLGENEAQVYFAALTLGPTTALKISRMTGIKRATTYTVIDALQRRGVVTIEMKGFKKLFVAEAPEKLEFILQQQKELLATALPDLKSLHQLQGQDGSIRYYLFLRPFPRSLLRFHCAMNQVQMHPSG